MIDTAVLWVRADAALRAGRVEDAVANLLKLIEIVDRIDFEYEEWLRALAEALRILGRHQEAAACVAYLGASEVPGEAALLHQRVAAASGDSSALRAMRLTGIYLSRAGHHAAAAHWFEGGSMPIHRAIELERAGADHEAAELWASAIERDALAERPYEQALARINYGLCLHRLGSERTRAALGEATRAVEEVADSFETAGLRERAFDCYQLLARVGIETDAFENIAEGYLNSVRILRDDGLKLDALRLYEAFVTLARRAREHHAVAAILREASDYCARSGLPYSEDLRLRCAEAWTLAAQEAHAAGHPIQIVENAYCAAAEAFTSVRAFRSAAAVYEVLAGLDLKGRERYRRILARFGSSPIDAVRPVPVPEFLKRLPDYEEVWYVDLAEWEIDGDPGLVAAGVMADRRFPDYVRRHGLLLVLELARAGERVPASEVVRRLQAIRAYPVIGALEQLYARGDASVKRAVTRAMGSLRFKRSFSILTDALRSTDPGVREDAATALSNLFFPHAFDRLRRIFEARDLPDGETARLAALRGIGRINTVEALDFLCDRLREDEQPYIGHVQAAIADLTNRDLAPYLRQQIDLVPPEHRSLLEDCARRLAS